MGRALIVDDEADARQFIRAVLEPDGWEIAEAENGQTGLEQARAFKPDLVILDIQMPEQGGFTMFNELKKEPELGNCKVIMLTGVREKTGLGFSGEEMGEFYGTEPDAYLEKPVQPGALKRVINRVTGND